MTGLPPLALAGLAWILVFAASIAGMWVGARLPENHRSGDTRTVVSVSMAMVGTLTAIALGLLLSVANTSYRDNQEQLLSTSSDLIRLDHLFRLYGPETGDARTLLKQYADSKLVDLFPPASRQYNVENEATLDLVARVENTAAELLPASRMQQWLQPRMLEVSDKIIQQHFALVRNKLDAIPAALIALLVFWLILLFASYGLYAPRHLTSVAVFFLSSGAAAGAILLIMELETPDSGFIRLTPEPLRHAIDVLERHRSPG